MGDPKKILKKSTNGNFFSKLKYCNQSMKYHIKYNMNGCNSNEKLITPSSNKFGDNYFKVLLDFNKLQSY